MKNTLLITGAEGFIGKRLVRQLEKKYEIVGVDAKSNGNITDRGLMKNIFETKNPDYVVHLAAALDNNIWNNLKNNIYGTMVIAGLCKRYGVKRLIFTSSAAVYGNAHKADERRRLHPINCYGAAKKHCENIIRKKRLPHVILRFSNVYGKGGQGVISKWKENAIAHLAGELYHTRDYVHVADVCRAIEKSIKSEAGNETFNVSTGIETDLAQLGRIMDIGGLEMAKHNQKREIKFSSLDNDKAQKMMGWKPSIDLKTGIEQYELL